MSAVDAWLAFVTPRVSVGTFMEIFYNAWVLEHPTYLIVTYKRLQTHPWLRYCATEIFKSASEFEAWYKRNYNGLQKS